MLCTSGFVDDNGLYGALYVFVSGTSRAGFNLSAALFEKYVGALPFLIGNLFTCPVA